MYSSSKLYMKKKILAPWLLVLIAFLCTTQVSAQDPVLPQNNFGLANMLDGAPKSVGAVWFQSTQIYNSGGIRDSQGNKTPFEINSLLSMTQFAWNSNAKFLGGHIGFTVLQPIVKLSLENPSTIGPQTVNPGVVGDLIVGPSLQWFNKRLFGKPFFHRFEIDAILPTGSYSDDYMVNPSAHLYMVSIHHAFTMFLNKKWAISMKNHYNFHSKIIDTEIRPGSYLNTNYSLEYEASKSLRFMTCGYWVQQLTEDSFNGDRNFYQNTFSNIETTKERVFAYGLGLSWGVLGGLIEAKSMFETGAINRGQGSRHTVRLLIPLWDNKQPEPAKDNG